MRLLIAAAATCVSALLVIGVQRFLGEAFIAN
jgi:hypothetical protein